MMPENKLPKDPDNGNSSNDRVSLDKGSLDHKGIITHFIVKGKTKCIEAKLNHIYNNKTIVSTVYRDWIKTIDRAKKKGIYDEDILMLTDIIDENSSCVATCLDKDNATDMETQAIEIIKEKVGGHLHCKLHPEVKNVHLESIEHHIKYKDLAGHKSDLLNCPTPSTGTPHPKQKSIKIWTLL